MLRAALRNRRSRLLFANYIRSFRAYSRSKNLTAVYAHRKAQETKFYGKLSPNLKSFFGDVFSQDKASKPPLYMHTARRKKRSFTGNSARTSAHFSAIFFRKTRKISADVQAYFKRNLTPYSGNSARISNHFPVMFFRKTRKISADVQAYSERNLTPYSGNSARTSAHFSAMFFRKTRKISDGVLSVLRAKFDAVFGKLSPNLSSFFGDVFSQDKENERRCTSVLQAKFDAVLRKNSPKNQISIMSASFFFAISSISLTYLSVIF